MKLKTFAVILLSLLPSVAFSQDFEGDGSDLNPYKINNAEDLATLAKYVNGDGVKKKSFEGSTFILTNNIVLPDASAKSSNFTRIGKSSSYSFKGKFDGNNKTISNLTLYVEGKKSSYDYNGLFGCITSEGKVYGLKMKTVRITVTTNGKYIGAIAGSIEGSASIYNCTVEDVIIEAPQCNGVGGITGNIESSCTVTNCEVKDALLTGSDHIGGVAGNVSGKNITENTSTDVIAYSKENTRNLGEIAGTSNQYTYMTDNKIKKTVPILHLYTDYWNFIGNFSDKETIPMNTFENNTDDVLTGFGDEKIVNIHEIVAMTFDYGKDGATAEQQSLFNQWSSDFLYIDDNSPLTYANGIMAGPLKEGWSTKPAQFSKSSELYKEKLNDKGCIFWKQGENVNTSSVYDIGTIYNYGTPNTDDGNTSNTALWFALSNPFNESISTDILLSKLNNVQGKNLTYVFGNEEWITGPQYIAPGQGFMVACTDGTNYISGQLVKTNSGENIIKSKEILTVSHSEENRFASASVAMNEKAANNFDPFDGYAMLNYGNTHTVQLYFPIQDKEIARNVFASLPYTTKLNIHNDGEYKNDCMLSFNIKDTATDIFIFFVDKVKQQSFLISADTSFCVEAEPGENEGKYEIFFTNSNALLPAQSLPDVSIWSHGNTVNISADNILSCSVYTLMGTETAIDLNPADNHLDKYSFNLDKGFYVIKVSTTQGDYVQKVIIP
ncbi:MAG: T9SS type A sorting domain-containing protein [Bacteroidales bacterium]|nr:T9SS type A sorting domain-containing protein [Bacteroidales bacterium]